MEPSVWKRTSSRDCPDDRFDPNNWVYAGSHCWDVITNGLAPRSPRSTSTCYAALQRRACRSQAHCCKPFCKPRRRQCLPRQLLACENQNQQDEAVWKVCKSPCRRRSRYTKPKRRERSEPRPVPARCFAVVFAMYGMPPYKYVIDRTPRSIGLLELLRHDFVPLWSLALFAIKHWARNATAARLPSLHWNGVTVYRSFVPNIQTSDIKW